jgi:hypothetical protein
MTIDEKIADLKKTYPTLTKGINDETIEMSSDEYETTIAAWAQNLLDQEAKEAQDLAAKEAAQAKLTALGLTADDLKALGL